MKISIVKIHFFTLVYLLICFQLQWFKESILLMSLLLIHECCHYTMARLFHYDIQSMTLYPFGAILKVNDDGEHLPIEDFLVAIAGLGSHLFFYLFKDVFLVLFGHHLYRYYLLFNAQIFFFNSLPIYPLDGYKALSSLLKMKLSEEQAVGLMKYISLFSLIVFILKRGHLVQLFLVYEQFYLWRYLKFEKSVKKRLF